MDVNGYFSSIINRSSREFVKDVDIQDPIHIGTFSVENPYTKKTENIKINVMHDTSFKAIGRTHSKHTVTNGVVSNTVMINWPVLVARYKNTGNISLKTLIRSVIQHELNHILDPSTRALTTKKYNLHSYKNDKIRSYIYKPTEVAARIRDVVTVIRNNIALENLPIPTLRKMITKPDAVFVDWLLSLKHSHLDNIFKYYAKEQPEIVTRLKRVLYREFLGGDQAPQRDPPKPVFQ
jgi:hypothetical protein